MQFRTQAVVQPRTFTPVDITLRLENENDLRWLYHLMNFQEQEISKGYRGNRKGDFEQRFVPFQVPDKKAVFKYLKQAAADQGVALKLSEQSAQDDYDDEEEEV